MSVFTIQTPSGRKLTIEADDEATALQGAEEWEAKYTNESFLDRAHREGKEAFSGAVESASKVPTTDSAIEGAGGILSAVGLPASYPLGAAGSLLGSGMTSALRGAGHVINAGESLLGGNRFVDIPDWEQTYTKVRPSMDTALLAMGVRAKVSAPSTKEVGAEAKQLYNDVLSRSKYVPVSDAEAAAISARTTAEMNNAGMRAGEFPFTHGSVAKLATPTVNDLAEVVSLRRSLEKPGRELGLDKKTIADIQKREGPAIGEGRKTLMSEIENIDPISAERLLAADKEFTVFSHAKDVDRYLAVGKASRNFDVSGVLRENFGKIARDPDRMRKFSPDEQQLIEGLAGGRYNMLTVLGKLDPRRGGMWGPIVHAGAGYASGGVSAAASGLGFAAQVLSNRMAISKANKLGELIRSKSSLMPKVKGPMAEWGQTAMAFQADPSPKNFARLSLASKNFSSNLGTIGIDFSPANLMKSITGTSAGRAEGEDEE